MFTKIHCSCDAILIVDSDWFLLRFLICVANRQSEVGGNVTLLVGVSQHVKLSHLHGRLVVDELTLVTLQILCPLLELPM